VTEPILAGAVVQARRKDKASLAGISILDIEATDAPLPASPPLSLLFEHRISRNRFPFLDPMLQCPNVDESLAGIRWGVFATTGLRRHCENRRLQEMVCKPLANQNRHVCAILAL
jgi:hypothetical protein